MKVLPTLRTENFILRELKDSDKEDLFILLNDPRISKYVPGLYLCTPKQVNHIFFIANLNETVFLVIEDILSHKIVGVIFTYIFKNEEANVSYLILENKRGQGIMPKVLKAFISYLYINRLVKSIHFDIYTNNISSVRVLQKLNIPIYFNEKNECLKACLSLEKELPF